MSADDDERGQRRRRCGHLSWHRSQLAVTNSCANRAFAAEEGCQRDDAEDGRADTRGAELSHPFLRPCSARTLCTLDMMGCPLVFVRLALAPNLQRCVLDLPPPARARRSCSPGSLPLRRWWLE